MAFLRQIGTVLLEVVPRRLRPLVSGAIWERVMLVLSITGVAAKGEVDGWSFWQQLVAAGAVVVLLQVIFRAVAWMKARLAGPLDIEIESKAIGIGSYHGDQPNAPGTGYVDLPDVMIINREPKDVLIRITIRSPKLGTLIPIIEHIGGHVVIDNNRPPHLPTEIPLTPDGHRRGCAEFVLYADMRESGFADSSLEGTVVVFTDLLSKRTKETAPLPGGFFVGVDFPEPADTTVRITQQ